ncbi:hypothetical protein FZD47_02460 [Bacillus infantis]|uniref:Uncharacterized protein n=1 Tax=Bacillus infantis TaxID=324767 RepID=A0A5D4STS5_9BACI|nr:hypothetical protein [Bacillus infantis]TYS66369.1 hypothetical protein FZD47_02460 [Bacillus infantis]
MSTKKDKQTVLEETIPVVDETAKLQAAELPKEEPKQTAETVIYTGESLPGGTLQQFSIFKNGLPEVLNPYIEKCPAIKDMMVPLSQLSETRKNLLVHGSREHTLNNQIKAYIRGDK